MCEAAATRDCVQCEMAFCEVREVRCLLTLRWHGKGWPRPYAALLVPCFALIGIRVDYTGATCVHCAPARRLTR
jgi:hypothetical protein